MAIATQIPVHTDAAAIADATIDRVGKDVRLALPLGLGKSNLLANALFQRAKADPTIRLRIYTALTLSRPKLGGGLAERFGAPVIEKLFGDYPELDYAQARARGNLPENVEVEEFFLSTGTLLSNSYAQRHYNSVNYTHAMRRIIEQRVNVLGQMVATEPSDAGRRYSLSCNSDLSLELVPQMRDLVAREDFVFVGEINPRLPFMPNDAEVPEDIFDMLLETEGYDLAGPPAPRVDTVSHAIGLRAAHQVSDGGTLQIGIGSLGDGCAQALKLRHEEPDTFKRAIASLPGPDGPDGLGGTEAFSEGLYGCTEMFTQGLFELLKAGVLTRRAHEGRDVTVDGGFFLGPQNFYRGLRDLPHDTRRLINMTRVEDVNALYGNEAERRRERAKARFINIAMKVTPLGAVTSDALENGRVVSGVGGQYNFVAQAHELEGARSIILLKSTRSSKGKTESNIVWSFGHVTVPRHLRDIVITEYGVADLRGQPDEVCVKRMLAITDARFIDGLVDEAKAAMKLAADFTVPAAWRENTPENLQQAMAPFEPDLPAYPFGTELDETEQTLAPVLDQLSDDTSTRLGMIKAVLGAFASGGEKEKHAAALERLGLLKPRSLQERIWQRLILARLSRA